MNALSRMNRTSSVYQDQRPSVAVPSMGTATVSGAMYQFAGTTAVRVGMPNSPWAETLRQRFNELVSLPVGWDGYSAPPVTFDCAVFADNFLERLYVTGVDAPQLVPGSDGSIQIEWHSSGFDIELDVVAPYEVNAMRRDIATNKVEELELQTDFTTVRDWIASLQTQTATPTTTARRG